MSRLKGKGVTLTELLVVVAIIAVLTGIAWPGLRSYLNAAQVSTCTSNLKDLYVSLNLYMEAHDGISVGSPAEMGLPPLKAGSLMTEAFKCAGQEPRTCSRPNPYMIYYPEPGRNGIPESDKSWRDYVLKNGPASILVYDNGHSSSCPSTALSLNRAILLTLGGSVKVSVKRADPDAVHIFANSQEKR